MPKSLFLSHNHTDRRYASTLRDLLRSVSAGQLDLWFSSDNRPDAGLVPGDWYMQLRERLQVSKTLIALISPASIDNRWVHFECGLADALNATVIPVCIGLHSLNDLPAPLNRYQSYQLSDYESLKVFVGKLFALHDLQFFEEVAGPSIQRAIADFSVVEPRKGEPPTLQLLDVVEMLKSHIDQRFLGTISAPVPAKEQFVPYALTFHCKAPDEDLEVVVNIDSETTVTNVLDNTYFGIANHVEPYTYLSKWILRNYEDRRRLIVREVADSVPAHLILRPASEWEIVLLDSPYHPSQSDDLEAKIHSRSLRGRSGASGAQQKGRP